MINCTEDIKLSSPLEMSSYNNLSEFAKVKVINNIFKCFELKTKLINAKLKLRYFKA